MWQRKQTVFLIAALIFTVLCLCLPILAIEPKGMGMNSVLYNLVFVDGNGAVSYGKAMLFAFLLITCPLAVAAKKRGTKVYHLNIGQPDLPTPQVGLDALKTIDREILEYSPSQGYQSYREKLVDYYAKYNINVTADDIIITSGGSEAVLFAFMSCLNPGDEIIVPEPAYANYMAFAISAGAKIRTIATTIDEGFSLPKVEKFEELINDRTRAIMICNPNNPTGYLYTRREMNQIRDLVKKYDLYLFSDEVYREYIYTGSPYISACHLDGIEQNVILIDSVHRLRIEALFRVRHPHRCADYQESGSAQGRDEVLSGPPFSSPHWTDCRRGFAGCSRGVLPRRLRRVCRATQVPDRRTQPHPRSLFAHPYGSVLHGGQVACRRC